MEVDIINNKPPLVDTLTTADNKLELLSLQEDYQRLNEEFLRANEERAKAAEYGLVLLEEKQQLQCKSEELMSLYEISKQELDASSTTLREMSRDYEKRIKEMERQREQLIIDMEEREKELLGKVEGLEEERRMLERQLKKTSSQQEYLMDTNVILSNENEQLKRDIDEQKQETNLTKKELTALRTELEETRSEFEKTNVKIEKLLMIEQEFNNASKLNDTLRSDLTILQEQYEAIQYERDDLEEQTKEVYRALNEEREAKNILENRLHEGIVRSPEQMHWLAESIQNLDTDSRLVSSPSPIPQFPNLLNELQQSIEAQTIDDSMQEANERMKLVEDANSLLTVEKKELEEKLKTVHEDIERVKMKHQEMIDSKESDITSLKNEMGAKKEIIGQLKNKLNSLNGEKITLEIELEGIRDELNRTRDVSKVDIEKLMKEIGEEQNKSVELQGRVSELEEKLNQSMSSVEKLEGILFNSTNEVVSMKEEIYNLHKAVVSLHTENKFTPSDDAKVKTVSALPSNEESPNDYFLFVQEGKKKLRINKETQTISEVTLIREALRQVRIPLEKFTKMMLEHSLNTSSQHMPTANGISSTKTDDKKSLEMEATLSKMRARLANRNEEVNQLKTIMKARQTTVDVTVSSLKSKLEAQSRAHESEINQMKNKMKNIRKERDDQTSLCVLTSKRCQEYLDEIKKLKKKIEELKAETDQMKSETKLVNVYLQRAIKQKLDISQQLERYKEEEERTKVIPLTISASRV